MARDISKRIDRLRARRKGMDRYAILDETAQLDVLAKSFADETWQKRVQSGQPYTRYAIGAMQEVGPDYTRVSEDTAERVAKQLESGLTAAGFSVAFRLQGSVPLNVHIRGVSDVDLLNLDTSFYTYDRFGPRSQMGGYNSPTPKTSLGVLVSIRQAAERVLRDRYPKATVDTSGSKAIKISGGSLARPVDVVPSHWHDNAEYQRSGQEHDRGVTILDKSALDTIDNLPFLHIKRVSDKDAVAMGGLKKAIRLCKNVKADAIEDGTQVSLPSFDIAATMYHADMTALHSGAVYELAILAETQRFLAWLVQNQAEALSLVVPDGTRRVFDTHGKLNGLRALSSEIDDLAVEVAKEQDRMLANVLTPNWTQNREVLAKSYVPWG